MNDQTSDAEGQRPPLSAGLVDDPEGIQEGAKPDDDDGNADPAQNTSEQPAQQRANGNNNMGGNNNGERPRDGGIKWTDKGQFLFSLVLMGATVWLAANATQTLNRMKEDAVEQTRQFNEQMTEIGRQITASEDANSIAREALASQQRPWVSVRLLELGPLVKQGHERRADMKIEVTNYGKSPAISVFLRGRFQPFGDALNSDISELTDPANNPRFGRPFGQHILYPGDTEILEYNAFVLEKEIDGAVMARQSPEEFYSLELLIGVAYWPTVGDEMLYTYRTYRVGALSEGPGLMSLQKGVESEPLTGIPSIFKAK